MTTVRLLTRSLLYYWRTNLAVLLGVVAATAVIGGALIVGDSVRDSLREMSLERLGKIDHVLHGPRFFREAMANDLAAHSGFSERFESAAPGLIMRGTIELQTKEGVNRVNQVNVYGVDQRLWEMTRHGEFAPPTGDEILLSQRVAEQLQYSMQANDARAGQVLLRLELPTSIPSESLFGERDDLSQLIELNVRDVLPSELGVARLELNPNQQLPLNVFVSLSTLQDKLGLAEQRIRIPAERRVEIIPAKVNALFVSANNVDGAAPLQQIADGNAGPDGVNTLNDLLDASLYLDDLDLNIRKVESKERPASAYFAIESERMLLENEAATAARTTAKKMSLSQSSVLVYLGNAFRNPRIVQPAKKNNGTERGYSMYSVVAGLELKPEPPYLPSETPFGPFLFAGDGLNKSLGERDIVINDWLAEDLEVEAGETIEIDYHIVGSHGELPEKTVAFRIAGIVQLEDESGRPTVAADRGFTPHVRGITDVKTYDDWDEPFDMKTDRITARDDTYWEEYKATPKAFISLEAARKLWNSRYGGQTSVRLMKREDKSLDETIAEFTPAFLANLDAEKTGLVFQPVKFTGLLAASGTTDFSGLFIGFSFFLILSATILIVLLFRLGIERRSRQIGLLQAIGLTPKQLRRLFLGEGMIVVVAGGLLGMYAAVGYASVMIYGLKTWWIGAIGTQFLDVSIRPVSLFIGFTISVIVALAAIWWALRQLRNLSSRELLSGQVETTLAEIAQRRNTRSRSLLLMGSIFTLLLLAAALFGFVPSSEAFAGLSWQVVVFFVVGILLLALILKRLSQWLQADRVNAVQGYGLFALGRLGMRNAARNRQRSLFTVGLIASATFVIVAVAAGQRNPTQEQPVYDSGNGGFTLVAETDKGILFNLSTTEGRSKLGITPEESTSLEGIEVIAFRRKPGEEASCLNIYQTRVPTILGVPDVMIQRGGFKFADTPDENPWSILKEKNEDGLIPVLGDMNTLMYSLKKEIGSTITLPDKEDPEHTLQIAGMLDGSVFQGVLLMSETHFRELFPDRDGYEYFLIGPRFDQSTGQLNSAATSSEEVRRLSQFLETRLSDFGFDVERVVDRIAGFLAVQNTYLQTFQTLGGLGLFLGTLGLATVMLRNVLERRSELALLQAVGFRKNHLRWIVLWENAFLLLCGLFIGAVSALLAMLPHLRSTGANVPWKSGGMLLFGVFVAGMFAAWFAVAEAVRMPILATLRSDD